MREERVMPPATTPPEPPSDPSIGQLASCAIGATLWSAPLFLLVWTATLALYPALTDAAMPARGPVVFILTWGAIFVGYLQIYGDRNAGWTALDRMLVDPKLSLQGKLAALRANAVAYVFMACLAVVVMKVALL
jgi:hypothetical protein